MNNRFEALNGDDVVSVNPETFENLDISHTSRVVHLLAALQEYFYHATNEAILFTEGIDCEVLRLGAKGWQKGKVRINLNSAQINPANLNHHWMIFVKLSNKLKSHN